MSDDRDFIQREAESRIRVSKPIRMALGILVLLGATFFVFVGGLLLAADRSSMPRPTGTLFVAMFFVVLGSAFGYVGVRLIVLRRHGEYLLTARGTRIGGYCFAVIAGLGMVFGVLHDRFDLALAGLFALPAAYWLYTSAKAIGRNTG